MAGRPGIILDRTILDPLRKMNEYDHWVQTQGARASAAERDNRAWMNGLDRSLFEAALELRAIRVGGLSMECQARARETLYALAGRQPQ